MAALEEANMHTWVREGPPFEAYFLSYERTVCDVTEGGELIAFAIADVVHPRISRVRVHELHVCQRHRRRGHATGLVLHLDSLLPSSGWLEVQVHAENSTALSFYEALHFTQHTGQGSMRILRRIHGSETVTCTSPMLPSPQRCCHPSSSPQLLDEAMECEVVASIMEAGSGCDTDGESDEDDVSCDSILKLSQNQSLLHDEPDLAAASKGALVPATSAALAPATSTALVPDASTALVPATSTALVPATSTALTLAYEAPKGGSQKARMVVHQQQLSETCLSRFKCSCPAALAIGQMSCLAQFSRVELQQSYHATYGAQGAGKVKLADVSKALHHQIWALKEPRPGGKDSLGRTFRVTRWQVLCRNVCKAGWRQATGCTPSMQRRLLAFVMGGYGPEDKETARLARLQTTLAHRQVRISERKRMYTVNWWSTELRIHDWLPNEQRIRFRGNGYEWLHKHVYSPVATHAGEKLSYKTWMKCIPEAVQLMVSMGLLPGSDPDQVTVGRSAKHSHFPECTKCQQKRMRWHNLSCTPGVDPALLKEAFDDMVEHQTEWSNDRKIALAMKYSTYDQFADTCYECDDKCGSFWQQLPVSATGRDTKANVRAKYHFSIHANVVCGPGGLQRFTVVPKNVSGGGANFGLTNLIVALHAAWKSGKIGPHVTKLIRHTDGGPDNVSWVSHLVHWLLVYIGAFNDLLWFVFEAGHSHTEIADRLFALMKKLFESDSNVRVRPVQDFVELEGRLREVFAKAKEEFQLGYIFANWDFASWFQEHSFEPARDFKGYSFDLVFKYTYVGEALWQHGGVQVLYKDRLSYTGTAREAEWKPIQRAMRSRPSQVGTEEVEVNETVSSGVLFVQRPPDLRTEPPREDFSKGDETKLPKLASASAASAPTSSGTRAAPSGRRCSTCTRRAVTRVLFRACRTRRAASGLTDAQSLCSHCSRTWLDCLGR